MGISGGRDIPLSAEEGKFWNATGWLKSFDQCGLIRSDGVPCNAHLEYRDLNSQQKPWFRPEPITKCPECDAPEPNFVGYNGIKNHPLAAGRPRYRK